MDANENKGTGAGTAAVVLGGAGLTALTAPLVHPVLMPLALLAPLPGIAAVVCGIVARSRTRRGLAPAAGPARAGIALGTLAVVVPVLMAGWAFWALNDAYSEEVRKGDAYNSGYGHGHDGPEYTAPDPAAVAPGTGPRLSG
ncbi:hypothetical protein [Streptomyces sp. NPDC048603]|uniref:hypothetical protein n=1 Tax=Streptomyces sp. NPDC048603 TaxID=3365577 RepID=UPI00371D2B99